MPERAPAAAASAPSGRGPSLALALREERRFPELLGGYALELSEANLVVNEKVPVPRFNFVQDVRVGPGRVAGFIEHTLEHYYQRALRPSFELPTEVRQPWVEKALGLAGYQPCGPSHRSHLMVWNGRAPPSPARSARAEGGPLRIEALPSEELDSFVDLLVDPRARYREEVRRYLEVGMSHPNPGERVVPYVACVAKAPISFGLLLVHPGAAGLFAVGTEHKARERGHATALVAEVLRREGQGLPMPLEIRVEGPTPPRPLMELGFEPWASYDRFALSPSAQAEGF